MKKDPKEMREIREVGEDEVLLFKKKLDFTNYTGNYKRN